MNKSRGTCRDEGGGTMMKKAVIVGLLVVVILTSVGFGREIVVTSTADSGTGSFRWALQAARSGDVITFDPAVFPPSAPATIAVDHVLPSLTQGNLTIDGSDAGVILDGQRITEPDVWGLEIISNGNTIRGLQIVNFSGIGIIVVGGAQHNTIGGDRTIGSGPLGQGNLCSGNNGGICLWDEGTSYNTITGNLIGTDVTGTEPFGNIDGMFLSDGASHNTVGPDNVIAYNRENAIVIQGSDSVGNRMTQNSIHDNAWGGIQLLEGGNDELPPPLIASFDWVAGVVTGTACPNGTIEIFSDSGNQGEHSVGQVLADEAGAFWFVSESPFTEQHLTATVTSPAGDTSPFSLAISCALPTAAREFIVTSTADAGTGTLRWALEIAKSGDIITFDPSVFPPDDPTTIYVTHVLPSLTQGNLTIDASNADAILDGGNLRESYAWGLEVISNGNNIYGLQVINFPGFGIQIVGGSQYNTIGGDRSIGIGPLGQGNLCSGNNGGILLCDEGTSHNTVTGNFIGTDVTGVEPFGNVDGVFVVGGASHNTIGPSNIIAYNHERAIGVQGSESIANRITGNSIHHNSWGGILLLEGGNGELPPPLITSFNVILGKLTGTACPGCTVELFSEETAWEDCDGVRRLSAEGRIFEGSTKSTHAGTFSFDKGTPFVYPHLTATATDTDGNTSEFSLATSSITRSWGLQANYEQPLYQLEFAHMPPQYNRIGSMLALLDSAGMGEVDGIIHTMDSLGFMWNKFYIDVPDWPEVGIFEGYSDGNVTPAQDMLVDQFVEQGLKIVLGLVFWDESANGRIAESGEGYSRYETEEELQAYLDHIQSIVRHFKGRVEYYEILNEPNAHEGEGVQQYVSALQYINLVRRAVPVIRQEDPQAKIIIGAVACVGLEEEGFEYLFSILRSDVMHLVDAVSWHPFDGASPSFPALRDYYYGYSDLVQQIKDIASSNGFTGEYMASEIFWRTTLTDVGELVDGLAAINPWGRPVYSVIQAAKYFARGITLNLGLDIITGTAGEGTITSIHAVVRNLCTIMAGHEAIDMPVEIDIDYDGPVAYCSFRYPNGDRMLAIWTDGIAQDEDPGVSATIRIPGLTAETVTGIDVLHGFEQELVFETDGDRTIIRDLLVKDYPIFIRLSDVTMGPDYEETVGDGFHRLGDVNAVPSSTGGSSDRDGDGVPDDEDYCPDWPGSKEANGC